MKSIKILSLGFFVAVFFNGCTPSQYSPKSLLPYAKGITTVESAPYGCKYLGNIEGYEEVEPSSFGVVGTTYGSVRRGALNDLKNNAVDVVKKLKRPVLFIMNEKILYMGNVSCTPGTYPNAIPQSYIIEAQIFECGDR